MSKIKFFTLQFVGASVYCAITEFIALAIGFANADFIGSSSNALGTIADLVLIVLLVLLVALEVLINIWGRKHFETWKVKEIIISVVIWVLALPAGFGLILLREVIWEKLF